MNNIYLVRYEELSSKLISTYFQLSTAESCGFAEYRLDAATVPQMFIKTHI